MHPYMAKAIAEERVNDFIRMAEANRKARDGAELGIRRRRRSLRRRSVGQQLSHAPAHLVAAHAGDWSREDDAVQHVPAVPD